MHFFLILFGLISLSSLNAKTPAPNELQPFYTSGKPVPGSIVDCTELNQPIVNESQRITAGSDGHLYADGKRIRLFGTNVSTFPQKSDAEYWAKTLASQGFNVIRFHHTDSNWTNAFFRRDSNNKLKFNENGLDEFDFFFNELKKAGIYVNLNLLTGRDYTSADGLPEEIEKVSDWKERHAFGFWDDKGLAVQKKYAHKLLTHRNPYTGLTYAEDPAMAIVEINNENSFYKAFLNEEIDRYPESLKKSLNSKYKSWLKKNGWTQKKLAETFNQHVPVGRNLITESSDWVLEQHEGAKADLKKSKDGHSLHHKISVRKNGVEGWHVQYNAPGLKLTENTDYTLKFKAKASKNCTMNLTVMQAHDPWHSLSDYVNLKLTKEWQSFEFHYNSFPNENNARLNFGQLGLQSGTSFEIKDIEFYEGGDTIYIDETKNEIAFPTVEEYRQMPSELKQLVAEFLYETDEKYWTGMNSYLKKDLKFEGLTMGTVFSCAEPSIMAQFDIVDAHAYWHHPAFPNASWNSNDFYVNNQSLTTDAHGGTLTTLAIQRIYGKPFSVTEYDHPYPSNYSAEMMCMYASYASFQDWDCIYNFCYQIEQKGDDSKKVNISGYFDQANNPVKICACPVAARIFRNFMVKPSETYIYALLDKSSEIRLIAQNARTWDILSPVYYGITQDLAKQFITGVILGNTMDDCMTKKEYLENTLQLNLVTCAQNKIQDSTEGNFYSSTDQICWNKKGLYSVNADDVYISVTAPGQKNAYREKDFMNFIPENDFAAFAAVKISPDKWLIFSGSWSGNSNESLRVYGTKTSKKSRQFVIRDNVRLTVKMNGRQHALALSSAGTLKVNDKGWKLQTINADGSCTNVREIQTGTFEMKADSGTLWYILQK